MASFFHVDFYKENRIREPASFNFYQHADKIFTLDDFAQARPLLDKAAKELAGDPEALARVEFLKKGLHQAELTIKACMAYRNLQRASDDPALREALLTARRQLDDHRKEIESDNVVFSDYLVRWENQTWQRK